VISAAREALSFDQALLVARERAARLEAELVPIAHAAGRRLAEDIPARVDLPGFTGSAMDGYAVRAQDLPGTVRIVGESAAGAAWGGQLARAEAVRISTGGPMPDGADAVVRLEDAREQDGALSVDRTIATGRDVRERGEVIRRGQMLLAAGAIVASHAVGAIAAVGHAAVRCVRRPRVAILGSGNELVPAGAELPPFTVYDSNRPGVAAQACAAGALVVAQETVADDPAATRSAIERLLGGGGGEPPDLLVTVGGISRGRHDHLRAALAEAGVDEVFFGLAVAPCRPTWLGQRDDQLVLGLPGNPVSAAVALHMLGRPLLGDDDGWDRRAALAGPFRVRPGRAEIMLCREEGNALRPLPKQGSHVVTSLARATALALIEADRDQVGAGERVRFSSLP
jgi:molybdopterin molybdotransferase